MPRTKTYTAFDEDSDSIYQRSAICSLYHSLLNGKLEVQIH
jgi:hypothetical protein